MASDEIVSLGIQIARDWMVPVGRQFGYVLFYKKKIEDLEVEVKKLHHEKVHLENLCAADERNNKVVLQKVLQWIHDAKVAEENATALLNGQENANTSCCRGWIPNPKTCYKVGLKATNSKAEMQQLILDREKLGDISIPGLPEGVVAETEGHYQVFESRIPLIEEIVKSLSELDVSMVGIYGQSGVGKSTLIKQLKQRVWAEKLFDEVVMATISENSDTKIRTVIAENLGLIFKSETDEVRKQELRTRLQNSHELTKQKRILLILDDLEKKLDLEAVGIPRDHKGVKLLLTSASKDVLSVEMGCEKTFLVKGLTDTESLKLFKELVGKKIPDDPKVNEIEEEVVQYCMGLPLRLQSVASALKNRSHSQWGEALEGLKSSKDVNSSFELSYKNLDDDHQTLFLICYSLGMADIPVEILVKYTVGIALYEGNPTMQGVRDRLKEMLHCLQASSLLFQDKEDGDRVKMNYIVRKVAYTKAKDQKILVMNNNDYRLELLSNEKIKDIGVISLPWVNVPELPEGLQSPELKMFIFYAKRDAAKIPDSFFQGMHKLKVLDLTNLRFDPLPSSIQFLDNLTTLCVEQCKVGDVSIIGSLKQLQILSFNGSKLAQLPKEIRNLCKLRMLDLTNCSELKKIYPGVLKSLAQLEELKMKNSFTEWERENELATQQSNARLSELNSMPKLRSLDIHIPDANMLSGDLPVWNDLLNYRILVGDMDWFTDYNESRMLKFKLASRRVLMEEWVQTTLSNTHELVLDGLGGIKKSIHELSIQGFRKLKHLRVQNSPIVQYIVRSTEYLPFAFPLLESLVLKDLVNLEMICHGHIAKDCFSKLKVVKVKNCGKLKSLFCHSLMQRFSQLEEVKISDCEMFREIVDADVGVEGKLNMNATIELPNLRRLTLDSLPELRSVLGCAKVNSSLESDSITRELELLLRNVTSLIIYRCKRLRYLFTLSGAKAMDKLKELYIFSCEEMEQIIEIEEEKEGEEKEMTTTQESLSLFSSLSTLFLVNMTCLKAFAIGWSNSVSLPQLKALNILKCGKMEAFIMQSDQLKEGEGEDGQSTSPCGAFFSRQMNAFIMQPRQRSRQHQRMQENQSKVVGGAFFSEKVLLPSLEELKLYSLNSMRSIFDLASDFKSMGSLRSIEIRSCTSVEVIFETTQVGMKMSPQERVIKLKGLEKLALYNLPKLKRLPRATEFHLVLPSLRKIYVGDCHSLTHLLPLSTARHLMNLSSLYLSCCDNMLKVIDDEDIRGGGGLVNDTTESIAEPISFPCLPTLHLMGLKSLVSFSSGSSNCAFDFPSLVELKIEDCGRFETFIARPNTQAAIDAAASDVPTISLPSLFDDKTEFPSLEKMHLHRLGNPRRLWDDKLPLGSFNKLKSLTVNECDNLLAIFQSSNIGSFNFLEKLRVVGCKSLEEIFQVQGKTTGMLVPLRNLEIHKLPKMKSIWDEEPQESISFGMLEVVTANNCGSLDYIFPVSIARGLVQLREIVISSCEVMKEMVRSLQVSNQQDDETLDHHQLLFPKLSSLKLRRLKKLKRLFPHNYIMKLGSSFKELYAYDCGELIKTYASELVPIPSNERNDSQQAIDKAPVTSADLKVAFIWSKDNICRTASEVTGVEDIVVVGDDDANELVSKTVTVTGTMDLKALAKRFALKEIARLEEVERLCWKRKTD